MLAHGIKCALFVCGLLVDREITTYYEQKILMGEFSNSYRLLSDQGRLLHTTPR